MSASIVACRHCGAKNRIPADKPAKEAKCGRCHQALDASPDGDAPDELLTLRCGQCRTKNRVPTSKIDQGAKCGRCGAALQHEEVLTGRPVMVTDANFDQTVIASPLPVPALWLGTLVQRVQRHQLDGGPIGCRGQRESQGRQTEHRKQPQPGQPV